MRVVRNERRVYASICTVDGLELGSGGTFRLDNDMVLV